MLKKLTTKDVSNEQREFAERTAQWSCIVNCRGCHHGDHYVEDLQWEATHPLDATEC